MKPIRRSRRLLYAAMASLLTLGTLGTFAAPVSASATIASAGTAAAIAVPQGQSLADWTPYLMAQAPLDTAAQQMIAAGGPSTGFTSAGISVAAHSVTLYWKGPVDSAAAQAVSQARSHGITVDVRAAKYSKVDLAALTTTAFAQSTALSARGLGIVSAAPRQDGSGIDVGVEFTPAASASVRSLSMATLAAGVGLGPDTSVFSAKRSQPADRFNDGSPHWAGARIIRDDGHEFCTSGWPMRRTSDGRTFMLTARHCGGSTWWAANRLDDTAYNDIFKFGDVWQTDPSQDAETIRAVVGGATYDGGVAIGTEFSKPISGAASGYVYGLSVCESGSYTGVHCGLTVNGWDQEIVSSDVGSYYSNEIIASAGNGVAMGKGDSGGPLFTLDPHNSGRVIARGMMSLLVNGTFLWHNNNNLDDAVVVSHVCGFTDINLTLGDFGATIVTG